MGGACPLLVLVACGGVAARPVAEAPRPAVAAEKPVVAAPANPGVEGAAMVPLAELPARLRALPGERWYGLYIGDSKVGYGTMSVRVAGDGEPGGFVTETTLTLFQAGLFGKGSKSEIRDQLFYAAEAPFRLVERRETNRSPDGVAERIYRVTDAGAELEVITDGAAQPPHPVTPSRETLSTSLDMLVFRGDEVKQGATHVYFSLDLGEERDDRDVLKVVSIEKRPIAGVPSRVVSFSMRENDDTATGKMVVAEGGGMLEMSLGGLRLVREPQRLAESGVVGFHIVRDGVPIDGPIGNPEAIRELHVLVSGIPEGAVIPATPYQQVHGAGGGKVALDLYSRDGGKARPQEVAEALRESGSVDFDNPSIAELARRVTRGAPDTRTRVERLRRWVYDNLEKDLSTDISVASQVLARKRGDCTEHALLLTALARSLGIPARRVDGLIYMGDELQRFGWHEWTEVAIDGVWVPVDPSWESQAANATHILLGREGSSNSTAFMGTISLERVAPPKPASP